MFSLLRPPLPDFYQQCDNAYPWFILNQENYPNYPPLIPSHALVMQQPSLADLCPAKVQDNLHHPDYHPPSEIVVSATDLHHGGPSHAIQNIKAVPIVIMEHLNRFDQKFETTDNDLESITGHQGAECKSMRTLGHRRASVPS